jgi:hypothetical protein
MKKEEYLSKYWDYYLNIENDVINTEKFVTFSKENKNTYSIEYIKIYQEICSEIDVVFRLICGTLKEERTTISDYSDYVMHNDKYKNLREEQVKLIKNDSYILKPFEHIDNTKELSWWQSYQEVKHHRIEEDNYKKANLENILQSLAGLYILNVYFFHENYFVTKDNDSIPLPKSKLFVIKNIQDNVVENLSAIAYEDFDENETNF